MIKNQSLKRFISGATCPKCSRKDTTVLYKEDNLNKAECVECGWAMLEGTNPAVDKPTSSSDD